jgi:hypothetical protein
MDKGFAEEGIGTQEAQIRAQKAQERRSRTAFLARFVLFVFRSLRA